MKPRKFDSSRFQSKSWCITQTEAKVMSVFMTPIKLYLMKCFTKRKIEKEKRRCGFQ